MAEVKKINGYDIIDYRITGIDTTVTEDSAKVVTSGAVYDAIETGGSALAAEILRATTAEGELEDAIEAETTARTTADTGLSERIANLESLGRYLALWDCTTGLPTSEPTTTLPYLYRTGDYFRIVTIATAPAVNYKPSGTQYEGPTHPSTTVETESVKVGDLYLYDGTVWKWQPNHLGGVVTNVKVNNVSKVVGSEANIILTDFGITADATELNYTDGVTSNIQTQLNNKQDDLTDIESFANNKYLHSTASGVEWADLVVPTYTASGGVELSNNDFHLNTTGAQTGQAILKTASGVGWGNVDALPSQEGQQGKFLTTNGSVASWATPSDTPIITVSTGILAAGQTSLNVSYVGTIISIYATKTSGEKILTDYTIGGGSVLFELGAAVDFDITCKVVTSSVAIPNANTEEF